MKPLTLLPRLGTGNVKIIERELGHTLDSEVRDFLMWHAGLSYEERYFTDNALQEWEVSQFNFYTDMIGLLREYIKIGWGNLLAFAHDPGGWHFCLSFDEDTFGKIIVNRWTDHAPEEQFVVIADSFEEFICGLEPRREQAA